MDEVNKYKIEDIIAFYNDKPNILFSWKENLARQYYIIEKYNEQEIIFLIINDNNDFIIDFSYILKEDFNKIKGLKFCKGNGMGYPIASPILKSLHEIIWGKKAEKGGWKLLLHTEDGINPIISTRWITMISGRSINQYDPDPE